MSRWMNAGLFLLLFNVSVAQAVSGLRAGPMAGANGMRSTHLWLQTEQPGRVDVLYRKQGVVEAEWRKISQRTRAAEDNVAQFVIDNLEPGTVYEYRVVIDGQAVKLEQPLRFHTQKLWQFREDPPEFTLMTGSCSYFNETAYDRPGRPYGKSPAIFDVMAKRNPELMLWLGDNVYFREVDYLAKADMHLRYWHDRALPSLQKFLRTGHHLAIWDDHDYGPNDSNKSWVHKAHALELFQRYWANDSYGLPGVPGVFGQFSYNDVDLFLLDDRYYRDGDKGPETREKRLFGQAQMDWLKNALLASRAPFKIIAGGGQFLNLNNPYEGWNHFPFERQEFLDWLARSQVEGVLFLSGDRHHTELLRMPRKGAYPLYELTCSPLTSGSHRVKPEKRSPPLVEGTKVINTQNFCELHFSGPRKKRQMEIRVFDASGAPLMQHVISATELRNPR